MQLVRPTTTYKLRTMFVAHAPSKCKQWCHNTLIQIQEYTCTVILEIIVVVDNLRLKETTKIKSSIILFEQIFTTENIYI